MVMIVVWVASVVSYHLVDETDIGHLPYFTFFPTNNPTELERVRAERAQQREVCLVAPWPAWRLFLP